ncbi:aspartate aminotransferase family protein [Luteimonas abyssi]|uniref:aspartate aminotransferase family protein n=1 Tax=Luteimonas abyssi TaxID=1247514 RepID=UPI000737B90C|nr:aspartate aminotransferase family protein [Luteimonas abyssi]
MSDPNASATDRSPAWHDDRAHVFHSWSAQGAVDPVVVTGAEGAYFHDESGRRWLDFSSQLVNANAGHQHPRIVAAIQAQAASLCTIAPYHTTPVRGEAARLIASHAPGTLDKVFFTNGGAEAIEHALRLARLHTGRHKILSAYRSYHGATSGAIAATGDPRRWGSEPVAAGFVHFWGPYPYRSAFHATTPEQECERALAHLAATIQAEGPGTIAAIVLESVVGSSGILVPPDGYLAGVRRLCDTHGIVMIADEVMCGFGRCGEWFALDRWDVVPDLIAFAKGVNSGYVPLGGVLIAEHIAAGFVDRPYPGGLTYSGHPLACAAAVACIRLYEDEGVIEHARAMGEHVLGPGLRDLHARHPSIGEVRGLGMFWAVELVSDRDTREPLVPWNAQGAANAPMQALTAACKSRGLWPFVVANRLHIAPPLIADAQTLQTGLGLLDEALADALS